MARFTQCSAFSLLGAVLVSLQLVVVFQLSKHARIVDQSSGGASFFHQQVVPDCLQSVLKKPSIVKEEQRRRDAAAKKNAQLVASSPDGSFNGIPLRFKDEPLDYSNIHCVGDNYQPNSYLYRSCQFRNFCFDTEEQDFVVVPSPQEQAWLQQHAVNNSLVGFSGNANTSVALGGVNPKWGEHVFTKLKWFPRIVTESIDGYYQLPDDYVWVPYHSMAGFNAGHLVWDDFLPIYSLLTLFGSIDTDDEGLDLKPLLTRFVLKTDPLWATCDFNDNFRKRCDNIIPRFLPLMGIEPSTFSTTIDFRFKPNNTDKSKSRYVCSKFAAAGIGMLTDHATKSHGWDPDVDYKTMHNVGRGASLLRFRNFMMRNMDISTSPLSASPPFHITLSVNSSQSGPRNLSFQQEINAVQNAFSNNETQVHVHAMRDLSLQEQISLASKSAVYVTASGGGAVTATFLPRGATLIVYYQGEGSRVSNVRTYKPARLDWDLFNNLSYLRVHWIPVQIMNTPQGLDLLTSLIRNELDGIVRTG